MYLAAYKAARAGGRWRALALFAALTVIAWTAPILPVLFARAPLGFRIAPAAYLVLSLLVLGYAASSGKSIAMNR